MPDDTRLVLPPVIAHMDGQLCWCGDDVAAWQWIFYYLDAKDRDCFNGFFSGAEIITAYLLDFWGLTGHGGIIDWAWLETPGREALAFLRTFGPAWGRWEWTDQQGGKRGHGPSATEHPNAPEWMKRGSNA